MEVPASFLRGLGELIEISATRWILRATPY